MSDAANSVLGAVFVRPSVVRELQLEPDDFGDPRHREVFAAMRRLDARGVAIDPVTVHDDLEKEGVIQAVGGFSFLADLTASNGTAENAVFYADIVKLEARKRRAVAATLELAAIAREGEKSPSELAEIAKSKLGAISDSSGTRRYGKPAAQFVAEAPKGGQRYVVEGIIPAGSPCCIGGPPKNLKTMAAIDMAVCVASGQPWLGRYPVTKGPVLLVLLEDGPAEVSSRLEGICAAHGLRLEDIPDLHVTNDLFRFDSQENMASMAKTLAEFKPVLVVIDSLSRTHSLDENSKGEMGVVTMAWSKLCHDSGAAVVVIHHYNKANADSGPGARLRGTGDLFALVRTVVGIEKTGDDYSKVTVDGNMAGMADPFVFETPMNEDGAIELKFVCDSSDYAIINLGSKILEAVTNYYPRGPVSMRAIRRGVVGKNGSIDRAVRGMVRLGILEQKEGGYVAAIGAGARLTAFGARSSQQLEIIRGGNQAKKGTGYPNDYN